MFRRTWPAFLALLVLAPVVRAADPFDNYIGSIIAKAPSADGVQELKKLTPKLTLDHNQVLPDIGSALVVLETNEGRYAKLLVQAAKKKLNDPDHTIISTFLIDKFVTYRAGTERTVVSSGQNVMLFDGFHFSADLGGIVPEKVGGDLRFVVQEKDGVQESYLEPVGKARLFLLTKPMPEAAPKKGKKFVLAQPFEAKNFNGKYKVFDDGRRSGILTLKVGDDGEVTGSYISDNGGAEYDVMGKVGSPKHSIQFSVKLPRTDQTFQGVMFTGTGLVITGTSRIQDRETGFYATRIEEEE